MHATESVMLQGAEVWSEVLSGKKYRSPIAQVQRRGVLHIATFYRTVSEVMMLVITGVIPIDLLARERVRPPTQVCSGKSRNRTAGQGPRHGGLATKVGTRRREGQMDSPAHPTPGTNYYLTQFRAGHSLFRQFLYSRELDEESDCASCHSRQRSWEDTAGSPTMGADNLLRGDVPPPKMDNLTAGHHLSWSTLGS